MARKTTRKENTKQTRSSIKGSSKSEIANILKSLERHVHRLEIENAKLLNALALRDRILRPSGRLDYEPLLKDEFGRRVLFSRFEADIA